MAFAQITLAISDQCEGGLEGFAQLSEQLPVSVYAEATEDGEALDHAGAHYCAFVDLMDSEHTQTGEKCISLAQAAAILGLPVEGLISLGRQRLAQLNDEASDHIKSRLSAA